MKIDLHIHTNASADGEKTPSWVVEECVKKGISVMAIADHESTKSLDEGLMKAKELGITMIPATEIFCHEDEKLFHVLGYGIEYKNNEISKLLEKIMVSRANSSKKQFEKIREYGLYIDEEYAYAQSTNDALLPAAYVSALFNNPKNKNHPLLKDLEPTTKNLIKICRGYFSYGKPLYAGEFVPTLKDTVKAIHSSKGIAVLAHPANEFRKDISQRDYYLEKILLNEIDGVEAFNTNYTKEEMTFYEEYAQKNNLLVTYGSDFHGAFKPEIVLGELPEKNTQKIIDRLQERMMNDIGKC